MKQEKRVSLGKKNKVYQEAIKQHCYGCMGGRKKVDCEIDDCPLYEFRPFKKVSLKVSEQKTNNLKVFGG